MTQVKYTNVYEKNGQIFAVSSYNSPLTDGCVFMEGEPAPYNGGQCVGSFYRVVWRIYDTGTLVQTFENLYYGAITLLRLRNFQVSNGLALRYTYLKDVIAQNQDGSPYIEDGLTGIVTGVNSPPYGGRMSWDVEVILFSGSNNCGDPPPITPDEYHFTVQDDVELIYEAVYTDGCPELVKLEQTDKCPSETDCQCECGGFICCYKLNPVTLFYEPIKKIPKS